MSRSTDTHGLAPDATTPAHPAGGWPTRALCSLMNGGSDLLLLFGLIFPLVLGLIYRAYHLPLLISQGPLSDVTASLLGATGALPFLIAAIVAFGERQPKTSAIWVVAIASVFCRLTYVLLTENALTSDYKTMWEFALSVRGSGLAPTAASIQEIRAIPYFLPLVFVASGDRLGFELANVLATTVAGLLAYAVTRDIAGARAGLAALVLILFAPEPIFACEVSTHDIPGVLFILGSVACLHFGFKHLNTVAGHPLICAGLAFLGGIFLGLAEVQRSTGRFLLIALLVVLALRRCMFVRSPGHAVQGIIGPVALLGLVVLAMSLVKSLLMGCCADEAAVARQFHFNTWAMIASYSGPNSNGDYGEYLTLRPELEAVSPAELPRYAVRKIAREYAAEPLGAVRHYVHKAERLFNLGRQGGEYYGDSRWRQGFDAYNGIYAIILAFFSAIALTLRLALPAEHPEHLLSLLFLSVLSLGLIAVGEIQSRYAFAAWYVLPMYLTITLSQLSLIPPSPRLAVRRTKNLAAAAAFACIPMIVVSVVVVQLYG